MSTNQDHLTTFAAAISALLAALLASACDEADALADHDEALAAEGEEASGRERASAPAPRAAPAPEGFAVEDVVTGGAGCPDPASVAALVSADKQSLRLIFAPLSLKNPPGPAVKTTNCQAAIKLKIPAGWRFSIRTLSTRGFASLDQGVKARQTSSYTLAGAHVGLKLHTDLEGPHDDFYAAEFFVSPASAVWSACGGSAIFSVNTSLILNAVANPGGHAAFSVIDQRVVSWQWTKC